MAGAFQQDAFQNDAFQTETGPQATDAPSTSDSATRVVNLVRSASDAPFTSDSAKAQGRVGATDHPATTDVATRVLSAQRSASSAPSTTDQAVRTITVYRAATDHPSTTDVAWATLITVGKELTLNWLIYISVGASLTTDYQIVMAVGIEASLDYRIAPTVGIDLTVNYEISPTVVNKDLTLDYRVGQSVGVYLTIDYAMAGSTAPPPAVERVVIKIAGVDVTPHVRWAQTNFESMTNGSVGTAMILYRDDAHTYGCTVGSKIELFIDGERVWYGFAMKVDREYVFDYEDRSDITKLPRYFRIRGSDINILFERRWTFNQDDPTNFYGPKFTQDNTPDIDAIRILVNDWLDLRGDGIDVTSMVEHVGEINVDQPATPFSGGVRWGDAMATIALLPAAVFYIDPGEPPKLVYTDVDTPSNPLVLSDRPQDIANGVGYREAKYHVLGDKMTNDYLAWGAGQGAANMVFHREEAAASIATHGRWQDSTVSYGIFRQATINRVADSVVNGSPTSHRGHKDDRKAFECATFHTGFRVAQKVRVINGVHGLDDVIPIRKMRVTFPAPQHPKFELTLSHEIDAPWTFWDITRLNPLGLPPVGSPIPIPIPLPGGGSTEIACTVLDSFGRSLGYGQRFSALIPMVVPPSAVITDQHGFAYGFGWGSGEYLDWVVGGPTVYFYVDGGAGTMDLKESQYPNWTSGGGGVMGAEAVIPPGVPAHDIVIKFRIGRLERLYPIVDVIAAVDGIQVSAGGEPFDIVWDHLGLTYDWSQNWELASALDLHVLDTGGGYGNGVAITTVHGTYIASVALPPGGGITKTIILGNVPTDSGGTGLVYPYGPFYMSAGGGFVPGIYTYADSGGFAEGGFTNLDWVDANPGLHFFGRTGIRELLFAGPDVAAFAFDQKMWFRFVVGNSTVTFDRSEGGVGGYSNGDNSFPIGIQTDNPSAAGNFDAAVTIEPEVDYFLRIFRPTTDCTLVKLWPVAGGAEPADWTSYSVSNVNPDLTPNCDDAVSPATGGNIGISAQIFPMQQYKLMVDTIYACGAFTQTDEVPTVTIPPPPGSDVEEVFAPVSPVEGRHTIAPYVAGSLILWLNGLVQRKNVDYTESDPTHGVFTLLFDPDPTDQIIVRYLVA